MGILTGTAELGSWWTYAPASLLVSWLLATVIYRRTLHPLAHVPGPFFASVTGLFEFWHNHILGGRYFLLYDTFVSKYGPVVRIGPNRVLLADPDHYNVIYNQQTRFEKSPRLYRIFALGDSMFSQTDPALYRRQRAAMNPFFSRRAVVGQEDMIKAKAEKLVRLIVEGETALHYGFRALAIDVVTEYAFGHENCMGFLAKDDLGAEYDRMLRRAVERSLHMVSAFPALLGILKMPLPDVVARSLDILASIKPTVRLQVKRVIDDVDNGIKPDRRTIYHDIIEGLQEHSQTSREKNIRYLVDESFAIVGAAGDTTGNALTIAAYNVLTHPQIYYRLHHELRACFSTPPDMSLAELEKLPYLTGVVKEGLRLSFGVVTPLDRVVPPGGWMFNGVYIPGGYDVGMTSWLMHRDPTVFSNPDEFDPARWVDLDHERRNVLEKHLVPFSRGARICLGQQLAVAELYIALGLLFWQFDDLKLEPPLGTEDMRHFDYFSPQLPSAKPRMSVVASGLSRWKEE